MVMLGEQRTGYEVCLGLEFRRVLCRCSAVGGCELSEGALERRESAALIFITQNAP
mgnify:CR=1 FL=1